MQGKPTLHYFFLYARGEPIRMALWKSGIEFTDNRVTGDSWTALKESGKLPYGQVPALELADGTVLGQQFAIMNYIASMNPALKSNDTTLNAKAESIMLHMWLDVFPNIGPKTFSKADDRDAVLLAACDKYLPKLWEKLNGFLSDDKKYLTGDTITIYDIQVCSVFTDLILNPNAKDVEMWKTEWAKTPDRIKKYAQDFQDEMKEYLDARPKDCSI